MQTVKCSSKSCSGRNFYPNQLQDINVGGVIIPLCPDCYKAVMANCADKPWIGSMIQSTLTLEEKNRLNRERAYLYAQSEVGR